MQKSTASSIARICKFKLFIILQIEYHSVTAIFYRRIFNDIRYHIWYQNLSIREKLIKEILNNPRDVRFDDACKVAGWLGFVGSRQNATSHRVFSRPGEKALLSFQNCAGKIKYYQAKQLIEMIETYWEAE